MYSPELIDRVRNSVDIVGVIGERVSLKKAGRTFKGLCPFHNEKTPSFIVSPDKQLYYCFGCGAGGNVFTFLTAAEKMSFHEAVKALAQKAGVPLPKERAVNDEYARLHEANELAAGFFEKSLWGEGGTRAKEYLKSRGVREDTIRELRIGFAPPGWRNFLEYSGKLFEADLLVKAGLLIKDEGSGATYDRFRDRLMFPVENVSAKIVGFGGRALDESLPKYLNSPETAIYKKSETLYGFSRTKRDIREAGFAFLVEGYMDFTALYESGIRNVVAVSGTSLTPGHAKVLRGSVERVTTVFDGDNAGVSAAMRSIGTLIEGGLQIKVVLLPGGHDPDSYIRKSGRQEFLDLAESARDSIEFVRDYTSSAKEGREGALKKVVELLARCDDPISRRVLVERASQVFSFDENVLFTETERRRAGARPGAASAAAVQHFESQDSNVEFEYLALLVSAPSLSHAELEPLEEGLFVNPLMKKIAATIMNFRDKLEAGGITGLVNLIEDDEVKSLISRLAIEDKFSGADHEKVLGDYIKKLRQLALRRRAGEIDADIRKKEGLGVDVRTLLEEKNGIMAELKGTYG